jgi:SAM-dependent methyltransferase
MSKPPYHKYVFDEENRKFVGRFEEMYRHEDLESFDSWKQEDLNHLGKKLSFAILKDRGFKRILDVGCGKGVFTQLLKTADNFVLGVDVSPTAIEKASRRYPKIEFESMTVQEALQGKDHWDLILMMEILSYVENWADVIRKAAAKTNYLYLSLYLPPNPIGFVKSFDLLKDVIREGFEIETELFWNNEVMLIFARTKIIK